MSAQPFRSGGPPACSVCNGPRADLLSANGDPICKGCSMSGEANARLAKGRQEGTIGAIVGLVVGSGLLLVSAVWAVDAFGGSKAELRLSARAFAIMFGAGIVIVFTCIRNLRRLKRSRGR